MDAGSWARIQAAFDELIELDPGERAARLAQLRDADPQLGTWVDALLDGDARASAQLAALESTGTEPDTGAPHAVPQDADPLGLAGHVVSHYVIGEPLGLGGMGVVYRAEDTRLHRTVALKFLLPRYDLDTQAKARFRHEARALGAIDHPNICTVYDVGESEQGWFFLAMPCYTGETLRARLARGGSLPLDQSLDIATQVARGLAAAHAAGLVHRDLKPANIMLTADGTARILDFGLAKARDASLSDVGVVMGTIAYMSPEQLRGDAVDARTDLWSLGVVLLEMLTGHQAQRGRSESWLPGQSTAERLAQTHTGKAIEQVIERLLQVDPRLRYQSSDELISALNATHSPGKRTVNGVSPLGESVALSTGLSTATHSKAETSAGRRSRRPFYVASTIVLLAGLVTAWALLPPAHATQVLRYSFAFDSTETLSETVAWGDRIALSSDGLRLAYIGGASSQLLIRSRSALHATAIPGTAGAVNPFFSPDGRNVGFVIGKKLLITPIDGPPVVVTQSLVGEAGLSWGPDGVIYADGAGPTSLVRVEATPNAVPRWFTALDTARGEADHLWPEVLPNGKGVLFTIAYSGPHAAGRSLSHAVAVADVATGMHRVLVEDAIHARYAAPGYLLYVTSNRTLMARKFDEKTMQVSGPPRALTEGMRLGAVGSADLAISNTGTLVYSTGAPEVRQELVWVSRDGRTESLDSTWHGQFESPAISPDGNRVAVVIQTNGISEVWVRNVMGGPALQLTFDGKINPFTTWTPDGKSVTFASNVHGKYDLWTRRADGSAQAVLQVHQNRNSLEPLWSADGKWLVFRTSRTEPGAADILAMRPGVDTAPIPLEASAHSELSPALSPDGRWMAYVSDESGDDEVYVVPFPNTGAAKWAVTTHGGTGPLWSPHGGELFYRDDVGNLVAVEVRTAPVFSLGRSTILFPAARFTAEEQRRQYAVAPDGRRFLMIRPMPARESDKLTVVENWFEELKARPTYP